MDFPPSCFVFSKAFSSASKSPSQEKKLLENVLKDVGCQLTGSCRKSCNDERNILKPIKKPVSRQDWHSMKPDIMTRKAAWTIMKIENAVSKFIMKPKIDLAFKLLFGTEKHIRLLHSLLTAIFGKGKRKLDHLVFLNTELLRNHSQDKLGILDILAQLTDKTSINIEIQVASFAAMPKRSLFYWSRLYEKQLLRGNEYEVLMPCIVIIIADFGCLPLKQVHSVYHICEDRTGHILDDGLEIHFLELPKLDLESEGNDMDAEPANVQGDIDSDDVSLEDWLRFIRAESRDELEALSKKNRTLEYAFNELEEASMDPETRYAYVKREIAIIDEHSRLASRLREGKALGIAEGRIEGKVEGRVEGRVEGIHQIVQRLYKNGMRIEDISKMTELSEEDITKAISEESASAQEK